jgi:hypothetical protein
MAIDRDQLARVAVNSHAIAQATSPIGTPAE